MTAVGFLLKRDQPEAVELCKQLVTALRARGESELVIRDRVLPPRPGSGVTPPPESSPPGLPEWLNTITEDELPPELRFFIVLGGDGTMLYGAGLLGNRRVPMLGINLGHLGFLTCCSPGEAIETLHAALDGKLPLEPRQRLRCRVYRQPDGDLGAPPQDRHLVVERTAVNDVVLSQPAQARLFELDAYIDGDSVTTYRADGLIISTPTGSTAYSLAVGGPILMPNMDALVLSPICPHTLTARPLVTRLHSLVEVRPGRGADNILLTIDGQWSQTLGRNDIIQVTCAEAPLSIFRPPQRSFFDLLRTKLHWGLRS
jgi:NAD+ kinase